MKKIQHLDISNVGRLMILAWERRVSLASLYVQKEFSMQVESHYDDFVVCVFFVRLTDKQACLWF